MIKIKQITGLQTELDTKASTSHTHAASDITSGTFGSARIPNLDASKITSGIFGTARIPNLNASKITSGTFNTSRIPSLDISKITGLQTTLTDLDTRVSDLETSGGGGGGGSSIFGFMYDINGRQRITSGGTIFFGSTPVNEGLEATDTAFQILTAGFYEITYTVTLVSLYANRSVWRGQIMVDGTFVDGSASRDYWRHSSYGQFSSLNSTAIVYLETDQVVEIYVDLINGGNPVETVQNESQMTIKKL